MRRLQAIVMLTAAVLATCVLGGCTFGAEPEPDLGLPIGGPPFENCVPVECMFECCQGWNYKPEPSLRGGNVPGSDCEEVRQSNSTYSEYVFLMKSTENLCADDFKYFESGYCEVVKPLDVIKEFGPDGQPVYAGLSFPVCAPLGQKAASPLEGVELTPKE